MGGRVGANPNGGDGTLVITGRQRIGSGPGSGSLARVVAIVAVVCVVGCSATDAPSLASSSPSATTSGSTIVAPGCTPGPPSPGTAVPSPTGASAVLDTPGSAIVAVGAGPFASASTPDGHWVFVSTVTGIAVVDLSGATPALHQSLKLRQVAAGIAVTADGTTIVAGTSGGMVLLDAHAAEQGPPGVDPIEIPTPAAIDVAVTPDGHTGFGLSETDSTVTVVDLDQARQGHAAAALKGTIPVGNTPAGMTLTPDGRDLLVAAQYTTEADRVTPSVPAGRLFVIDVATARADPARAVIASAAAGCTPVRVVVDDRGMSWVTARGSNAVVAIDTATVMDNADLSRHAVVAVGPAPVGVAAISAHRLVVANSDRFSQNDAPGSLTVIDTDAALAGRPSTLTTLPAGRFPRGVTTSSDQRHIIVTNYDDGTVAIIRTDTIPTKSP